MALNSQQSALLPLLSFLLLFLIAGPGKLLVSARVTPVSSANKLFILGDSNVDTGNVDPSLEYDGWIVPYGVTYPGYPTGRLSDGRVCTDYYAERLGLETPVAYRQWHLTPSEVDTSHGMNLAFAGSGVFETMYGQPNMTIQIDLLENLIKADVFHTASSVALVAISGNDHHTYLRRNGSVLNMLPFVDSVIDQLVVNLKRIELLGVPHIAVHNLLPLGCLPLFSSDYGHRRCNEIINFAVRYHNSKLKDSIIQLNKESKYSTFYYVDLNSAFTQIRRNPASFGFENPLFADCCKAVGENSYCGAVNEKGEPMYTVCDDPKTAIFWDALHPGQAGWKAIVDVVFDTHKQFSPLNVLGMFPQKM